jgi:hypothetical protein
MDGHLPIIGIQPGSQTRLTVLSRFGAAFVRYDVNHPESGWVDYACTSDVHGG